MEVRNKLLRSSVFIICSFILVLPLSWVVLPSVGSVYRAVTVVLLVYYLFCSNWRIYLKKTSRGLLLTWILYTLIVMVSTAWSTNTSESISSIFGQALLLLIAIVFSTCLPNVSDRILDRTWMIIGCVWIFLFIISSQSFLGLSSRASLVLLGNETDPNEYSGALVVPVCMFAHQLNNHSKKITKVFSITIIALVLYIVFSTGSRGGLLAVLTGIVITFLTSTKLNVKKVILIAITSELLILFILYVVLPMMPADIAKRFTLESIQSTGGTNRQLYWRQAWDNFKNCNVFRMFFGYGSYGARFMNKTMHNQFIQQLIDYGLVGLVTYCVLLFKTHNLVWRNCNRYIGAFWGMIAMSMSITTGPSYKPFWIFLMKAFCSGSSSGVTGREQTLKESTRLQ